MASKYSFDNQAQYGLDLVRIDFRANLLVTVWLVTSPDDNARDGKWTIEFATKACRLTEWNDAAVLNTDALFKSGKPFREKVTPD